MNVHCIPSSGVLIGLLSQRSKWKKVVKTPVRPYLLVCGLKYFTFECVLVL